MKELKAKELLKGKTEDFVKTFVALSGYSFKEDWYYSLKVKQKWQKIIEKRSQVTDKEKIALLRAPSITE